MSIDPNDPRLRIAKVESRLEYLATKEDISRLETLIETKETSRLRWLIGILITVLVAVGGSLGAVVWDIINR